MLVLALFDVFAGVPLLSWLALLAEQLGLQVALGHLAEALVDVDHRPKARWVQVVLEKTDQVP